MIYKNLNNENIKVNFKNALMRGISSDMGLFYPEKIPILSSVFFKNIINYTKEDIALYIIKNFISNKEINETNLQKIIHHTLNFKFPLIKIHDNIYSFELFHGPTMAFKDVGARFMSQCLEYFIHKIQQKITILVATSGDTGGAVAKGFYDIQGIEVIVLYPSQGVTNIQETQITSLNKNIKSVKIKGSFDDCQLIVKKAFIDMDIKKKYNLTSANSINIGRLIPQTFYYFFLYKYLKKYYDINNQKIVVSVPSGNFGNIFAGLMSKKMGLPIKHFIASTNINDTIPRFLKHHQYNPKKTIKTISNAMDVSNPSNFTRIMYLYKNDINLLKQDFFSYSFNDEQTIQNIESVLHKYKYIMDPHGCIGYMGLKKYNNIKHDVIKIFLETAHPMKFIDFLPKHISKHINIPNNIKHIMTKKHQSLVLSNKYKNFKEWLLNR